MGDAISSLKPIRDSEGSSRLPHECWKLVERTCSGVTNASPPGAPNELLFLDDCTKPPLLSKHFFHSGPYVARNSKEATHLNKKIPAESAEPPAPTPTPFVPSPSPRLAGHSRRASKGESQLRTYVGPQPPQAFSDGTRRPRRQKSTRKKGTQFP